MKEYNGKHPDIYGAKVDENGRLYLEGFAHESNFVILSDIKAQYCQRDDQNREDFQELNISLDSSGVGNYFVLETKRWCFDNPKELLAIIEDFASRYTEHDDNY